MSDFPVIFHRSLHFPVIFKWAKVQHTESKMMFSQSEQSWKNVMQKQSFAKVLQNGVLKISQTLQDNTCVGVFFKKDCRVEALQHFRKKTLTQMFSCEACKIFENIFFYRTLPVSASVDNKSHTRLFTLSKQTFSSQRVTFLKQPIIYSFVNDKNKQKLMKKFFRLSLCELKRLTQ